MYPTTISPLLFRARQIEVYFDRGMLAAVRTKVMPDGTLTTGEVDTYATHPAMMRFDPNSFSSAIAASLAVPGVWLIFFFR